MPFIKIVNSLKLILEKINAPNSVTAISAINSTKAIT